MTDDSHKKDFPLPFAIKRKFSYLLSPDEDIDDVFSYLDFTVNVETEASIWSREKMTTTVSRPHNTLDKFFPKLCKQEPPDTETMLQIKEPPKSPRKSVNPDSSESEFEMVHNYKNKLDNSNSRPLKKKSYSPKEHSKGTDLDHLMDTESSVDSECNNELSLFHSTAIGKMHERVPLIGEESGICGSDNESSKSESFGGKIFNKNSKIISISNENEPFISKKDCDKNNTKLNSNQVHKKSPGESGRTLDGTSISINKTLTDNFGISDSSSSDESSNKDTKDMPLLKNMTQAHTLSDDEIIPPSQDVKGGIRLSLGPEDKSYSKASVKSLLSSMTTSNQIKSSILKKNSLLDVSSSEMRTSEVSLIDQLKNKMVDVRTLPQAGQKDSLFFEDLTEEEDIFLIQCPKNVDPASLVGQEFSVEGSSLMSLVKEGKTVFHDSFSIEDNTTRSVHILLHGKEDQEIRLGVYPLAGNIILTEATEVPELNVPEVEPPKKVEFPKGLEDICAAISRVSDTSLNESTVLDTSESSPRKKKKKRKREQIEGKLMEEEIINYEPVENLTKKKKRKLDLCEEEIDRSRVYDSFISPLESQPSHDSPVKIKEEKISPFKKSSQEELNFNIGDGSELTDSFSQSTTGDLLQSFAKKKKKKKKKSYDYENPSVESNFDLNKEIKQELNETAVLSSELTSEETVMKKKKKKKKHSREYDNPSDETSFDMHKQIKVELDETDTFSSEFHYEDSSMRKKKKKKRHASDVENEELFIKPASPEVTFLQKHKKKHKKHSIE